MPFTTEIIDSQKWSVLWPTICVLSGTLNLTILEHCDKNSQFFQ